MKLHRFALPALALALATSGLAPAQDYRGQQGDRASQYGERPGGYGERSGGYGQRSGDWDAPPGEFRDIQRQGYRDGIEGARRDFENHRRPNVNNRDEYRHPHVDSSARRDYREGFRRGYDVAMDHMTSAHEPR